MLVLTPEHGSMFADFEKGFTCPFCDDVMQMQTWALDDGNESGCWTHTSNMDCFVKTFPLESSHKMMTDAISLIRETRGHDLILSNAMIELYLSIFEIRWS